MIKIILNLVILVFQEFWVKIHNFVKHMLELHIICRLNRLLKRVMMKVVMYGHVDAYYIN